MLSRVTCLATAPTVAAPSSSSSQPPLPPLMERVRKIKRQLSMTLRGGNSGDKNMTESISSQDTGAHSDSAEYKACAYSFQVTSRSNKEE
ncbi:cyclin-dependent kinase 16 isoform X1 [Tachysurus ichikawai]